MKEARCRCCGINVEGPVRSKVRVCVGCDDCDGLHGDKLQGVLWMAVRDGKLDPYVALARQLIDDAQLTGRSVYIDRGNGTADLRIPDPPLPWLIVCGRALARSEMPALQTIVDAVLVRYIPGKATGSRMAALRAELGDALRFVDPSIMDVEVTTELDHLEPGHLKIVINAKTPTLGAVIDTGAADVEIPADILSRKRAEA